jgi:hypothetical protein
MKYEIYRFLGFLLQFGLILFRKGFGASGETKKTCCKTARKGLVLSTNIRDFYTAILTHRACCFCTTLQLDLAVTAMAVGEKVCLDVEDIERLIAERCVRSNPAFPILFLLSAAEMLAVLVRKTCVRLTSMCVRGGGGGCGARTQDCGAYNTAGNARIPFCRGYVCAHS